MITDPTTLLKQRINEIKAQLEVCKQHACDVEEVSLILTKYRYAYQLLRDFGFSKHGERFTGSNSSKLNEEAVKEIRTFYNKDAGKYSGYSLEGYANKYRVHPTTIKNVLEYKTYSNLK